MGGSAGKQAEHQEEAFRQLDVDADGKVTKAEWENAFGKLDKDEDGYISRKEWQLLAGNTVLYELVKDENAQNKAGMTRLEWIAAFDQVDQNCDGEITVQEWMLVSLETKDRQELTGQDKRLPLELLQNTANKQEEHFNQLDTDQDGDVTEEEWAQAFGKYDSDSDGSVSRKEWYAVAGNTVFYDAVKSACANPTGNLALEEWKAAFQRADKNEDGTINLKEFLSVSIRESDKQILLHNQDPRIENDMMGNALVGSSSIGRPLQAVPWEEVIRFIFVGRIKDATVLATCSNDSEQHESATGDFRDALKLASAKLGASERRSLDWNTSGKCYLLVDSHNENLYGAFVALTTHPGGKVFELLENLSFITSSQENMSNKAENGLDDALLPDMKRLGQQHGSGSSASE